MKREVKAHQLAADLLHEYAGMEDTLDHFSEDLLPAESSGKDSDLTSASDAKALSPSPAEEGRKVIELEEDFWQTAAAGSVCYVVNFGWWQRWCDYTGVRVEGRKTAHVEVRRTSGYFTQTLPKKLNFK